MSLLTILTYPDPHLNKAAEPVLNFDSALAQLCANMVETMYAAQGCGLAATQVGRLEHVFVLDVSEQHDQPICFINARILSTQDLQTEIEGCLSFPGIYAKVKRAQKINVTYQDPQGCEHILEASGLFAVCIQHELDHLKGIVFVDHLSRFKRQWALKKLKKSLEATQADV